MPATISDEAVLDGAGAGNGRVVLAVPVARPVAWQVLHELMLAGGPGLEVVPTQPCLKTAGADPEPPANARDPVWTSELTVVSSS